VPLFFICSGYLYQKYTTLNNFAGWRKHIIKKFLALGVPYFVFSTITWLLKNGFSGSVNLAMENSLLKTLFVSPVSPYWYLYILFFVFLITPVLKNKKFVIGVLAIAIAMKIFSIMDILSDIYVVSLLLEYEIWFVLGVFFAYIGAEQHINGKTTVLFASTGLAFLASSIIVQIFSIDFRFVDFVLGLLACGSIVVCACHFFSHSLASPIKWLSKYTLPVFLMHTIFAAPLRIVLLKLGITNFAIHTILGLLISIAGPILAAFIMGKIPYFDFLLYPNKYIKKEK
jgi:fucose 4-O-acetylase-like acetyltransferase